MTQEHVIEPAMAGDLGSPPMAGSRSKRRSAWGYVYAAPAVLVVVAFIGYPLASVIYHSFTSWDGLSSPQWVGLKNYRQLWDDPIFRQAITNNAIFAISVPIEVVLSLVLAYLIHERVPGWSIFRSTFFLPAVYSTVVVGLIASVVLLPQGPVNDVLSGVGLGDLQQNWLQDQGTALGAIIAVVVWANFGYSVLICLAGMSALDPQLGEAARLDGTGFWKILWQVYAPNMRRIVELVFVVNTITAFAYMLPYIFTMTSGGPGFQTYAVEYYIYDAGFSSQRLGYASALGVVLAAVLLGLGFLQIRMLTRTRAA